MRKITRKLAVVAAALTASMGLAVSNASQAAALSWTVTPAGNYTGTATNPTLSVPAATLQCASSSASGTLQASDADGTGIGTIASVSWTTCRVLGISFTVTTAGTPWSLNVSSFDSAQNRAIGTITGVRASISGPGCSATFAGPGGATSGATLNGYYDNDDGRLVINGGNLRAYNANCLGVIQNGQSATYNASYLVNPKQTITTP